MTTATLAGLHDRAPFRSHWPSVCPRCGIAHADAPERDRADALCADCRETYGHRWTQQARDEVRRLARELERWNEANARARAAYYADRRAEAPVPP